MVAFFIYICIVFAGFFAIMNPISGMSVFITLTLGKSEQQLKIIAFQSLMTAFLIVVCFSLAGNFVLSFFGISFTALRLTGGILISIIGYQMLQGETSYVNKPTEDTIDKVIQEDTSIAITPLGMPLLAGPGVIITAMNFSAGSFSNLFTTVLAFFLLCVITYYTFIFSKNILNFLGVSAIKTIARMMGLILAVIGIQMFLEGVYSAVTEFKNLNYF